MRFRENLRTWLVLGRVSNLPTVWSNLLAGWFLAGGKDYINLIPLLLGGSFLYVGGMFLNDFCDAEFDAGYYPERPIPSERISRHAVGAIAGLWFAAGLACLAPFGWPTAGIALLLLAVIVLYDFRHKNVPWAPLVMGLCRFLLYPLAASVGRAEIGWQVLSWGAALGLYVAGITYLARGENRNDPRSIWPLVLLLSPILLMSIGHPNPHQTETITFSVLFLLWSGWLLVPLWQGRNRSIGRVVAGLLAGIVWVDVIAVSPVLGFEAALFLLLFRLALLLQRIIPAT